MRLGGIHVVVAGVLALGGSALANPATDGASSATEPQKSLAWPPGAPAEEPVQLIVSVPEQHVRVYVGGELVAESPVSTGRRGYPTPTGVFSILDKRKFHRSNIYSRAPMPFMQRLTWSGIALHASNDVPDHPASHGCVRLPTEFAKQLYGLTELGAHVIISADGSARPFAISHPNLFQPAPPRMLAADAADVKIMNDSGGRHVLPIDGAAGADSATDAALTKSIDTGDAPPETASTVVEDLGDAPPQRDAGMEDGSASVVPADDPSPLRILVTRRTGRELVRDVQTLLKRLGFDPGELDGWMGKDTGDAIVRFQEARGLSKTGAMSEDLAAELYASAGLGAPPTGHIYVRRNFEPLFDAPVAITDPERPLGAHLFTAMDFEDGAAEVRWLAATLDDGVPDAPMPEPEQDMAAAAPTPETATDALGRIEIPASVRMRISAMLTPGSSMAISDGGISRETVAKGSDFVVLTQ